MKEEKEKNFTKTYGWCSIRTELPVQCLFCFLVAQFPCFGSMVSNLIV